MKYFSLLFFSISSFVSFSQSNKCATTDVDLALIYSKIFPFYYGNYDSLNFYSETFTTKLTNYISQNPETIHCDFPALQKQNCTTITSGDGLFRIYTWDTWQGGTMHMYNNICQFISNNKTITRIDTGRGDFGSYYTAIYTLNTPKKTYYLTTALNSYSSADYGMFINIYTIQGDSLSHANIIKNRDTLLNSILVEASNRNGSGSDVDTRHLIHYDTAKKILYIPIVLENGYVTNRYILYQFKGEYFECIEIQKSAPAKK